MIAVAALAACGSSSGDKPVDAGRYGAPEPGRTERVDTPNGVIYIDTETKTIYGPCDAVRPYVAEHGKPGGFACD
jgi:hypothetical protein